MAEMKDIQEQVDRHIGQFKTGYFPPMEQLARLTEELGELAREISHHYGHKQKKPSEAPSSLEAELGDLLFVTISLANSLDIDLSAAFAKVMDKYTTRDYNRYERIDEKDA